ncbi:MAG: pilus assembly protein [Candidatus Thiodiazotropha sp. (ex Monitilora ramsayi)]|nr:pilus assembly protein [Candidatus Thiodiazotropha sp. (ex Monitilora ramsayi)]
MSHTSNYTARFSQRNTAPGGQRGAVLIFALVLLLIMTVLAISGVGNSTLEQRMSGNYSHAMTAFQAAEQGLRVAEEWLYDNLDPLSPVRDADADNWAQWFGLADTSNGAGMYSTRVSDPDASKVCRGDITCTFNPRDVDEWCADAACDLPKGFVTLGETLRGDNLTTIGGNVAREPQFIIEYVGPAGQIARPVVLGKPNLADPVQAFRITVIGWGQDAAARHVLQSHVVLPL